MLLLSCVFLQLAYIAQFSNDTCHSLMTLYSNITKKTTPNRQQRSNFEVVVQPCTNVAFIGNLEWCRSWVAAEVLWPNATSIRMKRALIIRTLTVIGAPILLSQIMSRLGKQMNRIVKVWHRFGHCMYLRNSILSEKNSNSELEWGNKGLM